MCGLQKGTVLLLCLVFGLVVMLLCNNRNVATLNKKQFVGHLLTYPLNLDKPSLHISLPLLGWPVFIHEKLILSINTWDFKQYFFWISIQFRTLTWNGVLTLQYFCFHLCKASENFFPSSYECKLSYVCHLLIKCVMQIKKILFLI